MEEQGGGRERGGNGWRRLHPNEAKLVPEGSPDMRRIFKATQRNNDINLQSPFLICLQYENFISSL